MIKKISMAVATVALGIGSMMADVAPITVKWVVGENGVKPNHYSVHIVVKNVSNKSLDNKWVVGFNHFDRKMIPIGESGVRFDAFPPAYFKLVPSETYKTLAPGDSIVADFHFRGQFPAVSYYPDGAHFISGGDYKNPIGMKFDFPVMNNPKQWTIPGSKYVNYPDGNYVYKFNNSINPVGVTLEGSMYHNVLPTPRYIKLTGGSTSMPAVVKVDAAKGTSLAADYAAEKLTANGIKVNSSAKFKVQLRLIANKDKNQEYYEMTVSKGKVVIKGNSEVGVLNGVKTLVAVIEQSAEKDVALENVEIKDYPDLQHRGMMLDIVRNYTKIGDVRKLIDWLASYKLNVLHFHIADDEAWRIEIPGIPELTEIGSRKGTDVNEQESLLQTYRGNGNPDDMSTTANGYITRAEFIDLLKYAASRGVEVIPEIESPGHIRAALVSMKARYRKYINIDKTEAERYLMWDYRDGSVYYSAQAYRDNVLNVAMPGAYRFMEKVFDEIHAMYKEAGVPLRIFHLGGDEVARGAWEGSPIVKEFMKEKGMTDVHQVAEYYIDKMSKYMWDRGVKMGGWQEIAQKHSADYNKNVSPRIGMVNVWSANGRADTVPNSIANDGYPVIMSNVANFYLDMVYNRHQCETGLNWGGWSDEFSAWNTQPYNTYRSLREDWNGNQVNLKTIADGKPVLKDRANIVGVQAQLFAETIRGFDDVMYHTFPKIFGLAERGWNATPTWGEDYDDMSRYEAERAQYNLKIGLCELPRIGRKGVNFHVNQPGIIVENGMLRANASYPGVEVRYTLDGSEPTKASPLWTAPVPCGEAKLIKARAYYLGKESLTTFLFSIRD